MTSASIWRSRSRRKEWPGRNRWVVRRVGKSPRHFRVDDTRRVPEQNGGGRECERGRPCGRPLVEVGFKTGGSAEAAHQGVVHLGGLLHDQGHPQRVEVDRPLTV